MNHEENSEPTRPSRSRRWVRRLAWWLGVVIVVVILLAHPLKIHPVDRWLHRLVGMGEEQPPAGERKVLFYRNPMDPSITSPVPAKDSMGMDYVPVYADEEEGKATGERKVLFYRNPMDPSITSPVPAKDSMGMDYVPVYAGEEGEAAPGEVVIDPTVVQNMNVRTEVVERRDLTRQIRTVGYLDYDQGKMVTVTTKYPGYVEKVFVNYVGEPVRKGQPLFTVYSPELVQTQQELLSAVAYVRRLEGAPEEVRKRADALVEAARARLAYWDITPPQVQRVEEGGQPLRALTVTAPASGLVMMRMAGLEGMAVKPGMELLHIADLSSLWLSVEVFEDQLAWLKRGSTAKISLSYYPGETFTGRVRFVEPQVSEKTRTVGLRLEVPNRDGRLRAGMYATVVFEPVAAPGAVAVPSLAVLRTGERNLVLVESAPGRFAPREVELGAEAGDYVQVLAGLGPGERVVTSSQFLIDSESHLREAIQKFLAAHEQPPTAEAAGH